MIAKYSFWSVLLALAVPVLADPVAVSLNNDNKLLLEFVFSEQKSGGIWLSGYKNGQWLYSDISDAAGIDSGNGYWRYQYQSDLLCAAGDEFSLRIQGNYSSVEWLPGPSDNVFYDILCDDLISADLPDPADGSEGQIIDMAPEVSVSTGDGLVQLSWLPVNGADSYRIDYGYATGVLNFSQTTSETSALISGLDNGVSYDFVVVAIGAVNEKASDRISAVPQGPDGTAPAAGDEFVFGLESDGTLYHTDGGQSGDWAYLCLNGDCRAAVKTGDRYWYRFDYVSAGSAYDLQFKIQDDSTSQCIADAVGIEPGAGVMSTPCSGASTGDPASGDNGSGEVPGEDDFQDTDAGFSDAGGVTVENGVVISRVGERYRVRHELSGNDFNNFNIEYWRARFGALELRDYTRPEAASQRMSACGTSEPCVLVRLDSAVPLAMTDVFGNTKDCNQQSPNFRYHKIYGDETNFYYGYVMDLILPDGSILPACQASQDLRAAATSWQAVMRPDPNIPRPFTHGAQIEFEVTINFDRAQVTGDNVNYYGQTFRYRLGEGFVVNNQDPAIGPVGVNDSFAKLGGQTTIPHLSETGGAQRRLSFMQHAYNISPANIESWLKGRRLFHTDFVTGDHIELFMPGPQAQGGNLPFPEMAGKATDAIRNSCTECHTNNSVGPMQARQDVVPPKMIGLGLLEAIEDSQIEAWAAENGGTVSRVSVGGQTRIGRFGWRAETVSIEHQVAKALHDDMGVGSSFDGFGPAEIDREHLSDLVTYASLLAVPVPRENVAGSTGYANFQDFGCAVCHRPTVTTGSHHRFAELSQQRIHPFTDLLLHDLGEGLYRTAPLWGLGLSGYVANGSYSALTLMHDGLAASIDEAIQRHNGEAAGVKSAYNNASLEQQQALQHFLMNL